MVDFGKAFTYIFDDENWFDKLIVPVLVSLIPFIGQITLLGYVLRTVKNVAEGVAEPLPTFKFGEDLGRGFRYLYIGLVYALPIIILGLLVFIPVRISETSSWVLPTILGILLGGLGLAYALLMFLFQPIMTANFAVKDTFASAFEFKEFIRRFRNNITAWLLVLAGLIVASFIAPLGGIFFFIGALITGAYTQFMVAHLQGQAYAASEVKQ